MATYTVNRRAVTHARRLIDARHYVLNSDWGEAQPRADDETRSSRRTRGRNTRCGMSA